MALFGKVIVRSTTWANLPVGLFLAAAIYFCASETGFATSSLPTGGVYVAGSGTINPVTNGLVVNQTSTLGIITWTSFSIAQGDSVQINNGSGATLNRVTGSNMSTIAGILSATGSVYLINPYGVLVTPTGQVITNGSFVASTRDISNSAFLSGNPPQFIGTSTGTVVNQGTITSNNGDVILIGQANVSNSGWINAPNGTAAMAAGNNVLVQAPGSSKRILISAGGGNVTNTGTLAGAQVELNAASGNVYTLAGSNGGIVRATGTATINGIIWITGNSLTNSGTIVATNQNGSSGKLVCNCKIITNEKGGKILVSVKQTSK